MSVGELTDRQRREVEFHKDYAAKYNLAPLKFDILYSPKRRWWNAYWDVWGYLKALGLKDKRVLVVGCGAGEDAILFAEIGARVSAFDLSPDMLTVAKAKAKASHCGEIDFGEMPSEALTYPDATFDLIFACDILHHVDIPRTMSEVARVAKPSALFVANEIYSHSITDRIRKSRLVEKFLYHRMKNTIYRGETPYITEDERKMTERDIASVKDNLAGIVREKYFNFLIGRVLPHGIRPLSKMDRCLLVLAGRPLGKVLAGRIVLIGKVRSAH